MALSDEEKATLEALTRKANEPDEDDFDIEIWDETGAGAKVPYRKGRTWLNRFGIDLPEVATPTEGKPAKEPKAPPASGDTATRYFGGSRNSKAS